MTNVDTLVTVERLEVLSFGERFGRAIMTGGLFFALSAATVPLFFYVHEFAAIIPVGFAWQGLSGFFLN